MWSDLDEEEHVDLSLLSHVSYGVAAGAVYSALAQKYPLSSFRWDCLRAWVMGDQLPRLDTGGRDFTAGDSTPAPPYCPDGGGSRRVGISLWAFGRSFSEAA